MNTPSPLIPQGALPIKGKSNFFLKVLMILALHVVVIGGMLLQGCKDTKDVSSNPTPSDTASTTATPNPDTLPPLNPGLSNAAVNPPPTVPAAPTQTTLQPPAPLTQPTIQPLQPPTAPTAPTAPVASTETKEYVIASGDTLGAIAHKNGLSLKALMEANAGVNPKKLKVGQKIQIPGGAAATPAAPADTAIAAGDATVYTVKSGDTLSKIAKSHGTTFKKIMAANDLKTTSIKVGQKLKLPAPKAAATETPAAASTAVVPLTIPAASTTTASTTSTTIAN